MLFFGSKIRQVLGNPLLLDPLGLGGRRHCLQTPALLSIATTIKLYESAHISLALNSKFQSLVFMTLMAIQSIFLILFC